MATIVEFGLHYQAGAAVLRFLHDQVLSLPSLYLRVLSEIFSISAART